jgi:hypothetical protein
MFSIIAPGEVLEVQDLLVAGAYGLEERFSSVGVHPLDRLSIMRWQVVRTSPP